MIVAIIAVTTPTPPLVFLNQAFKASYKSLAIFERSSKEAININKGTDKKEVADFGYESITELDSIQKHTSEEKKVGPTEYWFLKKWLVVKQENTNEQIKEKFILSFTHNLPKVLFLYMPVFAFILWLFHDKKKWYYFDHSIFTLHYFSFILCKW